MFTGSPPFGLMIRHGVGFDVSMATSCRGLEDIDAALVPTSWRRPEAMR